MVMYCAVVSRRPGAVPGGGARVYRAKLTYTGCHLGSAAV